MNTTEAVAAVWGGPDSLALLATAIAQASETVVITDLQGTIQYANPAFERISGYTCAEAIGLNPRVLRSGKHDAAFYRQMWETLMRGETWRGRFINRKKDGTLYDEEATISPVRDLARQITHFVAVKRDITRELELEASLRNAQRLEALGHLSGGIAHEFNNILGVILGHAQLAAADTADEHPASQSISVIQGSARRASVLVNQILAFARQDALEFRSLDLRLTLANCLAELRAIVPPSVTLKRTVPAELPLVRGNGLQIHGAVLNLVTNSLHALEGRVGEVELVAEAVTVEADLAAATPGLKAGPHVCVSVRDTGCGMDAATVKKIFDPFFTTKPTGKGTGLGLSMVYGTLRAHGGAVAVASEPGKGTTFRLYFPVESSEMPKSFNASATPPAGLDSPLVLVDDDPALRQLATRMLRRLGYEVTACSDAPSALAHLESIAGQCAAVITDFNMPEMNGVEFARQMQHRWSAVPLVLISGFLTPEVTAAAKEAGVRSVVAKPFSLRCLDQALAEVLRASA